MRKKKLTPSSILAYKERNSKNSTAVSQCRENFRVL